MHNRCLLQVLLSLSSIILSKAQDVIGSGLSCVKSSPADDGQTRVTFLREHTAGALSLYLTLWSEDIQLVACEVNQSPLVAEKYLTACDRSDTKKKEISQRFNISALLAPDAPCALGSSDVPKFSRRAGRDGREGKSRMRRGVIFPGTLWCGTGSKAIGYDELGMFESADKCCREHDHCRHIIPSFTVNYGVFNSRFFTVSHCDCDKRFRQCLLDVNDTISSMVGYSFFSIIQVPCFKLEQQKHCTEMYWWGMCKAANVAPYAVFKSPLPYNSSAVARKHGDNSDSDNITGTGEQQVTKSPVISTKSQKSDRRCINTHRGDTFRRKGNSSRGKGCKRNQKVSTAAPSQMTPITKLHTTTPVMKTDISHTSKSNTLGKKRAGKKKSARKETSVNATWKSQFPLNVTTTPYPQTTTTTTQSYLSSTQSPPPQIHVTTTTAGTKTTKSKKKGSCCGLVTPPRGDAFQPLCRKCQKEKSTSHTTTITPSTTTYRLLIKSKTLEDLLLKTTTEKVKRDPFKKLRSRNTSIKPKPPAHEDGKTKKVRKSHLIWNNTSQESVGRTKGPNTPAKRGLADNYLLCGSLKHLDECGYKIPPMEKKYELQNVESKTAYHCDCTNRLALQIKSFKEPSILPTLLMDFVSQDCFKLPKKKKCLNKKSCSGGFTKASDLLQALKKIEGKNTAGVQNSVNGRKRGIPVRLSKRCLRLQREADIMAQLTRL
ncbi:group 3 secretory phospholipase A2-like [Notolabrus celidotus]|uniref:group 3 secretory phospholipase A2-like n=1 Tax=Notolabrus celidotus TaxID=1203425 RepID=UPI00148F4896|nr:group 3 secretory phospholipase A2-like [Notolabrus celidotus]